MIKKLKRKRESAEQRADTKLMVEPDAARHARAREVSRERTALVSSDEEGAWSSN